MNRRKLNLRRKQQSNENPNLPVKVLEALRIHCLSSDNGDYETTVPIPQVFYELLVGFY